MKLPKPKLNKQTFLLIAVFAFAFFVRFYNFPNRVTFWTEQARSLLVSEGYLTKPSLLGQEYFRYDSLGHVVFAGAQFNYLLVPLILLTKGDPISVTVFFALLNLFTGYAIYWVSKKIFNKKIAVFSTILFLFSNYMIYHSLFLWIYNPLPLVGILILYSLYRGKAFWSGFLSGIGVGLQIMFIPTGLLVFIAATVKSKKKVKDLFLFIFGALLGNLPMVLFDLKHKFYETTTLFRFFIDTLKGNSDAGYSYYYLFAFWPVFAILGGLFLFWLWRKSKAIAVIVIVLYIFLNLSSKMLSWNSPTGMPQGMNTRDVDYASSVIAKDAKGDFNVAEVLDFDKRAYVLRYFVQYKYGKKSLGDIEYTNLKNLYVLAQKDYNFGTSDVWEINAGGPYKISFLKDVGTGYAIYKLQK